MRLSDWSDHVWPLACAIKSCGMWFTDKLDQGLRNYTYDFKYGNGRCIRRFVTYKFVIILHNVYTLYRKYVDKKNPSDSKLFKMLKSGRLHTFFQAQIALGLLTDSSGPPSSQPVEPNSSDFLPWTQLPQAFLICFPLSSSLPAILLFMVDNLLAQLPEVLEIMNKNYFITPVNSWWPKIVYFGPKVKGL